MNKTPDAFFGSWTANRQQTLYANSIVTCEDILTLDPNGKMYRQYKTANHVFKDGGGKEVYQINVTVIGEYELKNGMLQFKNVLPRLDENSFEFFPSEKEGAEPYSVTENEAKAKLENKIAEVLMNHGLECRQFNAGRIPACQAYVDGDTLYLKDLKKKLLDKMTRCETPSDLDRMRAPISIEEALNSPETRFVNAIVTGENDYLLNATLYVPCQQEGEDKLSFTPLELDGKKYVFAFSDIHRMKSCGLIDTHSWRPATLQELASFMTVFDGICLNPRRGNTVGLAADIINSIVDRTWEGVDKEAIKENFA